MGSDVLNRISALVGCYRSGFVLSILNRQLFKRRILVKGVCKYFTRITSIKGWEAASGHGCERGGWARQAREEKRPEKGG